MLLAHGSDGVSGHHRRWAINVRDWGYNAVIIDHYTLRGIKRHTGVFLTGVMGHDRALDMIGVASWVKSQSWHQGKIAVIGFSQGGGGVLALMDNL